MGHTLLSLLLFTCLTICVLPAASSPTYQLGEGITFFATWGKGGKYKLDLEVYHREVKPIFLTRFKQAYTFRTFNRMCGTNPDFDIDKNGIVFPSAVRGQDQCTKAKFSLDLGQVVLDHQSLAELNDFEDEEVSIFETWEKGKYKIDIDLYHRIVKPKFITAFQNQYSAKKFNDTCGKNPDFDIDKEGWFWPNAVKGKSCSKKDYILDLGDTIVLECQKDPNCLRLNGELSVFETWGTGNYKLDMDVYHREVKPIFLTRFFSAYGTKFNGIEKVRQESRVWPDATKGKNCSKKRYFLDLEDVIIAHQPQAIPIDGEEMSDESVISRLENVIKVSKLQDLVFFILNRA